MQILTISCSPVCRNFSKPQLQTYSNEYEFRFSPSLNNYIFRKIFLKLYDHFEGGCIREATPLPLPRAELLMSQVFY